MTRSESAATACSGVSMWDRGWYRFAHRMPSPNFGARPVQSVVDLIVIHSISLPPGQFGGDEVQRLFTNSLDWSAHPYFEGIRGAVVSAHFYVRRNGELWQFVSCDDRAWHAGLSNYRSRANCNDYSIGIEFEGLEGGVFEFEQYETAASLCAAIPEQYPIKHIAGHEHIAPDRKADPGSGFDWSQMQRALAWKSEFFPPIA